MIPRILLLAALACSSLPARAQGYGTPLGTQGLERRTLHSAAARALGGTTFGLDGDVALMFANPAILQGLEGIRLSAGAAQDFTDARQTQQYGPLKYYSNFSLLMEGLTVLIPDPDTSLPGVNAGDTVQRPFDTLPPNWSRRRDRGLPVQVTLAVPFTLGDRKFVAGAGVVQAADLASFYQQNNVLSPSILSVRPLPVPLPPSDSVPVVTDWSQLVQQREGSLTGYGLALSGSPVEGVVLGVSGLVLDGSSDDLEERVARGRLTFYRNFFRLDSVYRRSVTAGRSDYSGAEFTLSAMLRTGVLRAGVSVKPPSTITRTYEGETRADSGGGLVVTRASSTDKLRLPWRGSAGIAVTPHERLLLAVEAEIRPLASAEVTAEDGSVGSPWLSSTLLRVGVQYTAAPWLVVRGGIRGHAEVFEQEGNPLPGEPVTASVYSAGAGLALGDLRVDLTYEYAVVKVADIWNGATSLTTNRRHSLAAGLQYTLPLVP